jgi:WD40 repeat protein
MSDVATCVCTAMSEFAATPNNCLKGLRWSPDGLCLLTAAEDQNLRLFELPLELLEQPSEPPASSTELSSVLQVRAGDAVYDYAWYPGMHSDDTATCVFASSSRDHPTHLWDAYTGECRASYCAYDHLDEVVAAHALGFEPSGQRLYCGFDRAVRIFDLSRPGRQCVLRQTCKTRRSREGQRGIISCFAFAPDYSGLYAAGSFSGTIGLYTEASDALIAELRGHTGGVTQLAFSHDGLLLYSGARRDGAIHCWDVRMSCRVLATFERACRNNQRVGFDLMGRHSEGLVTASQDGRVMVYDTGAPEQPPTTLLTFADATNAATPHPYASLLAVAVGERQFPLEYTDADQRQEKEDAHANGFSVWRLPQPPQGQGEQQL